MLFSIRDIELLRLLRWCRCIDPADLANVADDTTLTNLKRVKLIRVNKASRALMLTSKGNELLEAHFDDLPENIPLAYKTADTLRRIRVAKLTLTAYRAGFSVFTTEMISLEGNAASFIPTMMRGRGANPWSNSRIALLLRLGELLAAVHYVCPGIGDILLTDELNSFTNNTATIPKVRRVMIFAGESYQSVLQELQRAPSTEEGRLVSYADAYRVCALPVHLLSCDDIGALQIRVMAQPDYRRRLTVAALKSYYQPPPKEHPEWDAMFQDAPFIMAVDMELRRIDAAIESARAAGFKQVAMAALDGQAKAVLSLRYRVSGLARVFTLSEDAIASLGDMTLYAPSPRQFETREGGVINAPLIQADRKSGRQGQK